MSVLTRASRSLEQASLRELTGVVTHVQGLGLRVADLPLAVGALVRVESVGRTCCGEVVGFDAERTVVMLLGDAAGVRRGDRVVSGPVAGQVPVGRALVGRVLDALGRPLDGKGPLRGAHRRSLAAEPLDPMQRVPINQPLGTGVRAVDAMLPVGRGQRLGIFSGPGIGKSTLLGMIARQTEADVSVVALIGERGREVRDFIENALGPEGLKRSVVIAATADEPALMRLRAARYAACVAETFRDRGADVVLFMDSITRFCQAQRQVGLAAGEPPATRGYPPSVFAELPVLLERSGRTESGSITGFYNILVEGDDLTEPVADASRGILDGHIVLSRDLATAGHWPAIDVLESVSRVSDNLLEAKHAAGRREVGRALGAYRQVHDLVSIGAYAAGSNPDYDLAIAMKPAIDTLLCQRPDESARFAETQQQLIQLALQIGQRRQVSERSGAGASAA